MTATTRSDDRNDHDQLYELIEICDDVLRHADPATWHHTDTILQARGITGGPGWLIDMLAFTSHHNRHNRQNQTTP